MKCPEKENHGNKIKANKQNQKKRFKTSMSELTGGMQMFQNKIVSSPSIFCFF
jgi:hypothetical protein